MPRVAVLADIHGNLFALEAVIDDLKHAGVDAVIVAGDLVGRGPQGSAVVDRVAALGWPCIRGNHEDYLLGFARRDIPAEWLTSDEWAASRWMAAELGPDQLAFIDALPFSMPTPQAPPLRILHGSPTSHSEGIGVWTRDARLDTHLESIDESTLVCAHTHRPLIRHRPGGSIVNVGSVGLPFNGDPRAQYAIFTTPDDAANNSASDAADDAPERTVDGWTVELRQTPYDRDALLDHYTRSGFLREGKITAQLLKYEVETARPHLVPFLTWARLKRLEPAPEHLTAFFDLYDPHASIATFMAQLKALGFQGR